MADESPKTTATVTPPAPKGSARAARVAGETKKPFGDDALSRSFSRDRERDSEFTNGFTVGEDAIPSGSSAIEPVAGTEAPVVETTAAQDAGNVEPEDRADAATASSAENDRAVAELAEQRMPAKAPTKKEAAAAAKAAKAANQAAPAADAVAAAAPAAATEAPSPLAREALVHLPGGQSFPAGDLADYIANAPAWRAQHDEMQAHLQTYADTFGDPATAAKEWKPFVDEINSNPAFQAYVNESLAFWAESQREQAAAPEPAATAVPQAIPTRPSEQERELARLSAWQRDVEQKQAVDQATTEWNGLVERDARLSDKRNAKLVYDRIMLAQAQGDATMTATKAVAELARGDLLHGLPQTTAAAAAVPALLTGGGAAPRPSASSTKIDMRPQKFSSKEAALADLNAHFDEIVTRS